MKNNYFQKSLANIYAKPNIKSEITSQILYGEKFKVLNKKKNWLKIKTSYDKYTGYLKLNKLSTNRFKPSFKIFRLKTKIYKKIKNKFLSSKDFLYFGTKISTLSSNKYFIEFEKNRWIKKNDLKKIDHREKNFFKIFKLFLNTQYLWGGKTANGIDCSALIQIYFYYNRIFFPRDTKDQLNYCKKKSIKKLIKKNIIFWKGHVAFCLSKEKLIHAYGPKKKVIIMDINKTIDRIFKTTKLKPIYV